jgi:beta-N-acetylhexosaminidase
MARQQRSREKPRIAPPYSPSVRLAFRLTSMKRIVAGALTVLLLAACTSSLPAHSGRSASLSQLTATSEAPSSPATATSEAPSSPTTAASATPALQAAQIVARMSIPEQVGQLFMVGVPLGKNHDITLELVKNRSVGNIFLAGRSTASSAEVAALVAEFTAYEPAGLGMFVAVDQEGGYVQTLQGPGFSAIPTALAQANSGLTSQEAALWGEELAAAGVNLNLAPVADLVGTEPPTANAPIGYYERDYTTDPATIEKSIAAFITGMNAAGVGTVIKHFPGLGRVTENTDTAGGVTDTYTTRTDSSISIFAAGIRDGAAMVMASTAIYALIDPSNPAAFSPAIISGILRGELGYDGVCITDDVSAAAQVAHYTPEERALATINSGCDIILASADPTRAAAMIDAVTSEATRDSSFANEVKADATRVVTLKMERGLAP